MASLFCPLLSQYFKRTIFLPKPVVNSFSPTISASFFALTLSIGELVFVIQSTVFVNTKVCYAHSDDTFYSTSANVNLKLDSILQSSHCFFQVFFLVEENLVFNLSIHYLSLLFVYWIHSHSKIGFSVYMYSDLFVLIVICFVYLSSGSNI